MTEIDFHDAAITGIYVEDNGRVLNLDVKREQGDSYKVIFHDVYALSLTPFELQNVIYSITTYDSIEQWMIDEYHIGTHCPDDISLHHIDSSCGLGGIIFSKNMTLIKLCA